MPQKAWSAKRERQYEHIKESAKEQGALDEARQGDRRADRQQGARASGEAKTSSQTSREDISSGRRGGLRSAPTGPGPDEGAALQGGPAAEHRGRSKMNKEQLQRAVDRQK